VLVIHEIIEHPCVCVHLQTNTGVSGNANNKKEMNQNNRKTNKKKKRIKNKK
jgi:hypothetical protein